MLEMLIILALLALLVWVIAMPINTASRYAANRRVPQRFKPAAYRHEDPGRTLV